MNNKSYDASLEAELEKRNEIEYLRDNTLESIQIGERTVGKISGYRYKVLIRDKQPLEGVLSREEMDLIYRLYSSEGSNLQQRTVARYFPNITFQNFKRIIRAFNITKASSPLAPHLLEEKSTDELVTLTIQGKENDYLRKLEQDRTKLTEQKLKEVLKENQSLKDKVSKINDILSIPANKSSELRFQRKPILEHGSYFIVNLSDIHIGAYNSNESVYYNKYDEVEIERRLGEILSSIDESYDNIVVFNYGDSLDSYKKETTRGGHELPTILTDKEQSKMYLKIMQRFFNNLVKICPNVSYFCVGESNHDGNWGWINNVALANIIELSGVSTYIANKSIEYVQIAGKYFVYMHGKDNQNQFKGFPLTLDVKTENYFNEYLDKQGIGSSEEVYVIKGDQHQSAITRGKRFTYVSVSSLFGSSGWIMANFGNTPWGCDYMTISETGLVTHGLIRD
jgi:hypothetical protein